MLLVAAPRPTRAALAAGSIRLPGRALPACSRWPRDSRPASVGSWQPAAFRFGLLQSAASSWHIKQMPFMTAPVMCAAGLSGRCGAGIGMRLVVECGGLMSTIHNFRSGRPGAYILGGTSRSQARWRLLDARGQVGTAGRRCPGARDLCWTHQGAVLASACRRARGRLRRRLRLQLGPLPGKPAALLRDGHRQAIQARSLDSSSAPFLLHLPLSRHRRRPRPGGEMPGRGDWPAPSRVRGTGNLHVAGR